MARKRKPDNDDLILDYCRGVQSGSIVSGRMVRLAVDRYCDDMARAAHDDCPFYWDSAAADRAVRWWPAFLRHTEGEYSGKPFDLADFQRFIVSQLFGFKLRGSDLRRFRKLLLQVARGNGKSPFGAGLLTYGLAFDDEPRSQCYVSATKRDQARIVFDEVKAYARADAELAGRLTVQQYRITTGDGSYLTTLSSDGKTADGFRPHFNLKDELHAWRGVDNRGLPTLHRELHEKLNTAMAKRRQPLDIICTTAGDDASDIWLEEDTFCRMVVEGVVEADHVLVYIAEIDEEDDCLDESVWPKANPLLASGVVKIDALRQFAARAEFDEVKKREFRRYHCNRLTPSLQKPITTEIWLRGDEPLPDLTGRECFAGFDWGSKDDLAALGFVFPLGTREVDLGDGQGFELRNEYAVRADVWLPEDCQRDLTREPWASWIRSGQLTVTMGQTTDPVAIYETLHSRAAEYAIKSVSYDRSNAVEFAGRLEQMGLTAKEFSQSCGTYNEPLREFLLALKDGRLYHGGCSLLGWCATNMATKTDTADRSMPNKFRSGEKIDAIVAIVMAMREAMLWQPAAPSIYETQGIDTW